MRTKAHILLCAVTILLLILVIAACNGGNVNQTSDDIFSSKTADDIYNAINNNSLITYGFREIDTKKFIKSENAHNAYELCIDDVCYNYYLSDLGTCGSIEMPIYEYLIRITVYYEKREYMIELVDGVDNKWMHRTYVTDEFEPIPQKNGLFDSCVPVYTETYKESYNSILSYISIEDIRLVTDKYNNFTFDVLKYINE